jgi:hypothetical protein
MNCWSAVMADAEVTSLMFAVVLELMLVQGPSAAMSLMALLLVVDGRSPGLPPAASR